MELRKDYTLKRHVIISSARGKRPHEFKKEEKEEDKRKKACFFCPGNEDMTPSETGRIKKDGSWQIRWFPNKFPAANRENDPEFKTADTFFTYSSPYGLHEIIVETPDHEKQLWDLDIENISQVLKVYAQRIEEITKKEYIEYACVFKNHGKDAGTSIIHSHTQIIAYNKLPDLVEKKIDASKNFGSCSYCKIIDIEKRSDRRCFENDSFAAFTPYASRFHFEIWIFPKRHLTRMSELEESEIRDLASIMKQALSKLKELNISYNFEIFYAPEGKDLHFHIEISPRAAVWGGFELLTGETINSVAPEDAARFYRGENI